MAAGHAHGERGDHREGVAQGHAQRNVARLQRDQAMQQRGPATALGEGAHDAVAGAGSGCSCPHWSQVRNASEA